MADYRLKMGDTINFNVAIGTGSPDVGVTYTLPGEHANSGTLSAGGLFTPSRAGLVIVEARNADGLILRRFSIEVVGTGEADFQQSVAASTASVNPMLKSAANPAPIPPKPSISVTSSAADSGSGSSGSGSSGSGSSGSGSSGSSGGGGSTPAPTLAAPTNFEGRVNLSYGNGPMIDWVWTPVQGMTYEYYIGATSVTEPPSTSTTGSYYVSSNGNVERGLQAKGWVRAKQGSDVSAWVTATATVPTFEAPTIQTALSIELQRATWWGVTGASSYEYQITTNATPGASWSTTSNTWVNSIDFDQFAAGATVNFFVRVAGSSYNPYTTSSVTKPGGSSSLAAPASATLNSSGTAFWSAVTGASSYEYQVGTSSTPGSTWTSSPGTTAAVNMTSYSVGQTVYLFARAAGSSNYASTSVVKQASGGGGNSGPIFSNGVPDQTAVVGVAYSYVIPGNAATDADGDSITYSVSGLPAWLSYNSSTRALSGTPVSTGSSSFTVLATDSNGAQNSVTVQMTVTANQSPSISNAAANQSVSGGASFSYTLPNDHASDPEGGALTYSASGMPNWMSFNAGTKTFSGSAPNSGATSTITITVADAAGNQTTDEFDVVVSAVGMQNLTPVINLPIPNQTVAPGAMFQYALPEGYASDPENGLLTYNASGMPAWLGFNSVTLAFTGTAPMSTSTDTITVTVQDSQANLAQDQFDLVVQEPSSQSNGGPVLSVGYVSVTVPTSSNSPTFSFAGPSFTHPTSSITSYSMTQGPSWLSYGINGFDGISPSSEQTATVTVVAEDYEGRTASNTFTITVSSSVSSVVTNTYTP